MSVDCTAVPGLLPLIVTGRLSAAATARLGEHLDACTRCADRVERARTGVASDTNRVLFTTCDTVLVETPARRATSWTVAMWFLFSLALRSPRASKTSHESSCHFTAPSDRPRTS